MVFPLIFLAVWFLSQLLLFARWWRLFNDCSDFSDECLSFVRALKLPLRDVHDVCATGDIDYLEAFSRDEERRQSKGLGRPFSSSRKAVSPIRRAEYLQGSKIAEKTQEKAERLAEAARKRKIEEKRNKRKAEAAAAAKALAEDGNSETGSQAGDRQHHQAAAHDQQSENGEIDIEEGDETNNGQAALSLSVGAGATDQDKVPTDKVFPRPRLGPTSIAASEDAAFNTVGFSVVSVADLINCVDKETGMLPIHTACVFGQSLVVDYLMKNGADIESKVPGTLYTPLHLAVLNGHDVLARRLVETYNANPGALSANFELPLTIAKKRREAELQLYFKSKCQERIKSQDALHAALDGEVLFFAFHFECDADGGKKCFTSDYQAFRPKNKAPESTPGSAGVSVEAVIRDPVTTPLDVAIASMTSSGRGCENHARIVEFLLRHKFYDLNTLRESAIATTTLYLAVSIPTREGVNLLLKHGADPRVASVFNAAPTQILKLTLAEAEAKVVFESYYATRDEISFEDRSDFISTVTELRDKWRRAQKMLERALDREEAMAAAMAHTPVE